MDNLAGVVMVVLLSMLYYVFLAYNDESMSAQALLLLSVAKVFFIMTTFIYTLTQILL